MKQTLFLLATAIGYASLAQAQPVVRAALNAVSYTAPGLPGAGIAQGSIFAIFGSNLGPATPVESGLPRPTADGLQGTRVRVTVGATNYEAPIVFTSANQVNAIMPSNVPAGPASVLVLYNNQQSSPFQIAVVRFALGVVALNGQGSGPAVISNASNNYQTVTFTTALNPGNVGIIWSTGLGAVTPNEDINGAAGPLLNPVQVEVFIGGQSATVQYAARAPGGTGADQINFVTPDVEGCAVPIVVRLNGGNGVVSNFTSTTPSL